MLIKLLISVSTISLLMFTETDIIAQIEFGMKKIGINQMSFETMVLTGNNAAKPLMVFQELTVLKMTASSSSTWVLLVKAMFQI